MIKRYQSDYFKKLWSDQNRYDSFLKVEFATALAWAKLGLYDIGTYQKIAKASFSLDEIYELEKETKHDVIAFTRVLGKSIGDERKWIHYGLTSTDVVDSAQALMIKDANNIIKEKINAILETLKEKAMLYKDLAAIGRTHGIHAELTSFGLKFALWYADIKRINDIFITACEHIEVIKISGAVGNYAANTPDLEKEVSQILGMPSALISTQVLQRDRHANYISAIALLGSELEKIALEIRHLSRTEVGEVREYFAQGQKGSSAMPHKKNPIASENITGLSRVLRGYVITAFENIALWHERDISHSSAERIILGDATSLLDFMLSRLNLVLKNLVIDEKRINKNIELTHGVVFSQHILSLLIERGMVREVAYDLVQAIAHASLENDTDFIDNLAINQIVIEYVSKVDIKKVCSPTYLLRNVNQIYKKVFK